MRQWTSIFQSRKKHHEQKSGHQEGSQKRTRQDIKGKKRGQEGQERGIKTSVTSDKESMMCQSN
jgi:hypothetical protein